MPNRSVGTGRPDDGTGVREPAWTQEQAIAFGCARDYLAELQVVYATAIDRIQSRSDVPREDIVLLEAELSKLRMRRERLTVSAEAEVAEIRETFGEKISAARSRWLNER